MNTKATSLTQFTQTNNPNDPELAAELADEFASEIEHKKDGFVDRVLRRLSAGGAERVLEDGSWNKGSYTVEGVLDGDEYDEYSVDWTAHHLGMCSCYKHNFGTVRARKICTHVGAAIVKYGLEIANNKTENAAKKEMREMGRVLNESAKRYINKRESIDVTIDALDIADKFSENWADRAAAQATKMVENDDGTWTCKGGENEGHTVRLTAQGYKCDSCGGKFPTPCKLGAYVLNKKDEVDTDTDSKDSTDDSSQSKSSRQYHSFTKDEFEKMLSRTHWEWNPVTVDDDDDTKANFLGEYAYDSEILGTLEVDGEEHEFCIRVYSTVSKRDNTTRDNGDDSGKVLLWDKNRDDPVSGRSRSHRTENFLKNMQKKIEDLEANWDTELTFCDDGHLMIRRTGRKGEFLGCSKYPKCTITKDI